MILFYYECIFLNIAERVEMFSWMLLGSCHMLSGEIEISFRCCFGGKPKVRKNYNLFLWISANLVSSTAMEPSLAMNSTTCQLKCSLTQLKGGRIFQMHMQHWLADCHTHTGDASSRRFYQSNYLVILIIMQQQFMYIQWSSTMELSACSSELSASE